MIKSITIHKGKRGSFYNKLYFKGGQKERTIKFTDGVNIITGRNGSGKSILLKIIKYNCCITDNASYPRVVELSKGLVSDKYHTIPEYINNCLKNKSLPTSSIIWDGSMVHHLTPEWFNPKDIWTRLDSPLPQGKELLGTGDILNEFLSKNSKGEKTIRLLNRLYNLNTEYDEPLTDVNDVWKNASNNFQNWLNSMPKNGKPTLLIDELDTNLDLDNQKKYWKYINGLTKTWQVIVVSHSYFAFKEINVNHIPLNVKYFREVKKL